MPLYTYHCEPCSIKQPIFKKIAQLNDPEACPKCSLEMARVLEAPFIAPDYPGYDCPITGHRIEGKRAHVENLKKHGCRVLEPGETEQCKSNHAASSTAFEDMIANSAAEFVETLPARKREQLASELENGLDVSFTRQTA